MAKKVNSNLRRNSEINSNSSLVEVNKAAMIFCRAVFAIVLWIAFFYKLKYLVLASAIMMFFNVFLTVQYAPLILLYDFVVRPINPKKELIHTAIMQIVHFVMFLVNITAVIFIFYFNARIGYGIVVFMAIAKSIAALGFCPVAKLTSCSVNGCCMFAKNKTKENNSKRMKDKK